MPAAKTPLATFIAAARKSQGLTQEELARRMNVAVRTIQRLEAGSEPQLETLRDAAEVLGVAVERLLQLQHPEPPAPEAPAAPLEEDAPDTFPALEGGSDITRMLAEARAHRFSFEEPTSDAVSAALASFGQDLADYLDVWGELGPKDRVEAAQHFAGHLKRLRELGWVAVGGLTSERYGGVDGVDLQVVNVRAVPVSSRELVWSEGWLELFRRAEAYFGKAPGPDSQVH